MADVNIKYQGTSIATIDASGSKTLQTSGKYCEGDITVEYTDPEKPTQAKSATPTETAQDITPDSGKVLSKVSVGAIPKTYVGSGVTKKAAATVSPSTSEQTVCASGVYTTGAQKVAAITKNLLAQLEPDFMAANIKKDVDLFGLVGTLEAGGGGAVTSGKFTPTADIASVYTITHNLGVVPKLFVLFVNGESSGVTGSLIYAISYNGEKPVFGISSTSTRGYTIYQYRDEITDITNASIKSVLHGATSTTINVNPKRQGETAVLKAQKEYMWVACA